jgi:hypothetical protein
MKELSRMVNHSFARWKEEHTADDCETQLVSAGGFVWLVCMDCSVRQTMDEVEAGLPIQCKEKA